MKTDERQEIAGQLIESAIEKAGSETDARKCLSRAYYSLSDKIKAEVKPDSVEVDESSDESTDTVDTVDITPETEENEEV